MKTLLLKTLAGIPLVALAILVPSCATDPNTNDGVYRFDPAKPQQETRTVYREQPHVVYVPVPQAYRSHDSGNGVLEMIRHNQEMRRLDDITDQLERLNRQQRQQNYRGSGIGPQELPSWMNPRRTYW